MKKVNIIKNKIKNKTLFTATLLLMSISPFSNAQNLKIFPNKHIEYADSEINLYSEALTLDYDGYWILINSKKNKLKLYHDSNVLKEFHASIGKNGSSFNRVRGDKKTPTGEFSINLFNSKSRFHKFFRINYPRKEHMKSALSKNIITQKEYNNYIANKEVKGIISQYTKLGGQIGIHGLGNRSTWMNKKVNWTDGCIAISNKEIDDISKYIGIGTKVVII